MTAAPERATVAFLVSGNQGSAMGIRARSFAGQLNEQFTIHIAYRTTNRIVAIGQFFWRLRRVRPDICYVLDMTVSGVLGASVYRAVFGGRVIVDTGDAIYELARLSGSRNLLGLWLTKALERFSLATSDRVVVRSHPHQELLAKRGIASDIIPDGVDTTQFLPGAEPELRKQLGLDGCWTVGLLGSLVWNPRYEVCYGWELVELIHRLQDLPVRGVIIGDGSGLPYLKKRCAEYGIESRMVFLGRVEYEKLPRLLKVMDICLSTQTNDTPGQVRTTGKLPLYLATGRFVLATQVGEAARVLPPEMLLPYNGTNDRDYPARLAERVRAILENPGALHNNGSAALARTNFDYAVLADRLRSTICSVLPSRFQQTRHEAALSSGMSSQSGDRLCSPKPKKD